MTQTSIISDYDVNEFHKLVPSKIGFTNIVMKLRHKDAIFDETHSTQVYETFNKSYYRQKKSNAISHLKI